MRRLFCLGPIKSLAILDLATNFSRLTAEITEAARPEGISIGMKMVATGHSAVVELRDVVTVVEAAAGKLAGVLL